MRYIKQVLQCLRIAGLNFNITKCEFAVIEVKYLGYIVEAGVAIRPDPNKLKAIHKCEPSTIIKQVHSFLGFMNFYQEFIPEFLGIADLTKKGASFL